MYCTTTGQSNLHTQKYMPTAMVDSCRRMVHLRNDETLEINFRLVRKECSFPSSSDKCIKNGTTLGKEVVDKASLETRVGPLEGETKVGMSSSDLDTDEAGCSGI